MKRAAALVALLPALLSPAGAEGRGSGGTIGAFVVTARDVVVLGGDLHAVAGRIPVRDGRSVGATIDARTVVVTTPRGLTVIDGRRRKVVATIGGFTDPRGVTLGFGGAFAAVADPGRGEVIGVDVARRRIVWRVNLGGRPTRIEQVGNSFAVVSAYGERSLALLDLTRSDVPAVRWIKARWKVRVAAFTPDGEWLYLGYWGRRAVSKLGLFNRRVVSNHALRAPPNLLAVDQIERAVWTAEGTRAEVLSVRGNRLLGRVHAAGPIRQLAPVGGWMALVTRSGIELVATPSLTMRYRVSVPGSVRSVAFVVT